VPDIRIAGTQLRAFLGHFALDKRDVLARMYQRQFVVIGSPGLQLHQSPWQAGRL
jgi:hypothetical protein